VQIELDNLTAQERIDWGQSLKWYNDNGWSGDEASRLTWTDLQHRYYRYKNLLML
jgi:hypothetical protein